MWGGGGGGVVCLELRNVRLGAPRQLNAHHHYGTTARQSIHQGTRVYKKTTTTEKANYAIKYIYYYHHPFSFSYRGQDRGGTFFSTFYVVVVVRRFYLFCVTVGGWSGRFYNVSEGVPVPLVLTVCF